MEEKITPLAPADGAKCAKSLPHFNAKWRQTPEAITKILPEWKYFDYEEAVGAPRADIRASWKPWQESELGVDCRYPLAGESRTKWFCYLQKSNGAPVKKDGQWLQHRPVRRECYG